MMKARLNQAHQPSHATSPSLHSLSFVSSGAAAEASVEGAAESAATGSGASVVGLTESSVDSCADDSGLAESSSFDLLSAFSVVVVVSDGFASPPASAASHGVLTGLGTAVIWVGADEG